MDAMLAMQLDTLVVFGLVVAAGIFRFLLKQLSLCLFYQSLYEKQIETQQAKASMTAITPKDFIPKLNSDKTSQLQLVA